jgi:hypothetical protein
MGAVLPVHLLLFDQAQASFVDQTCSLKRLAGILTPHVVAGQTTSLTFDERH